MWALQAFEALDKQALACGDFIVGATFLGVAFRRIASQSSQREPVPIFAGSLWDRRSVLVP
jgi:hypothetical protein